MLFHNMKTTELKNLQNFRRSYKTSIPVPNPSECQRLLYLARKNYSSREKMLSKPLTTTNIPNQSFFLKTFITDFIYRLTTVTSKHKQVTNNTLQCEVINIYMKHKYVYETTQQRKYPYFIFLKCTCLIDWSPLGQISKENSLRGYLIME